MYEETVTLFNYDDKKAIWYPHILKNVHLETDCGQIIKKYGPESADKAILHIPYMEIDGEKYIQEKNGMLYWMPPKKWTQQEDGRKAQTITFGEKDFFWIGEWLEEGPVMDEAYCNRKNEGFHAYMYADRDFVYRISSISGPYCLIPHFEISGV